MTDAIDVLIHGNTVAASGSDGITITGGARVTVERNDITGNGAGVLAVGTADLLVRHNNFDANAPQGSDVAGTSNAWDDGYLSGGNYWSDYAGADSCSGPNQDACSGPDGIGDAPYAVDADTSDRYPLMAPWTPNRAPGAPRMLGAELAGAGLSNVTVTWELSADDGGGENDISGYSVFRGDTYDPAGAGYALVATLPAGSTSYTDAGAGVGDGLPYFYRVVALEQGTPRSAAAAQQAGKHAQTLAADRHLLSVPLAQTDWSVEAVLQTISWTRVRAYDSGAWVVTDNAKGVRGLTTLSLNEGLWVEVGAAGTWTIAGLVPSGTSIPLDPGWNLIGYPSPTPRSVATVLADVAYLAVEAWEDSPPYYLRTLAASDAMSAGNAYWLHVSDSGVLTVP